MKIGQTHHIRLYFLTVFIKKVPELPQQKFVEAIQALPSPFTLIGIVLFQSISETGISSSNLVQFVSEACK